MSDRYNKRVHMKVLVSVDAAEEEISTQWLETMMTTIERGLEKDRVPATTLKGFDIEHKRRR